MEFIDFEIWLDEVQIVGYLNTRTEEICWIGVDGLECYDDFSKTNYVGETATNQKELNYLFKWCLIQDFLSKMDIIPHLLKHQDSSDEAKITFGTVEVGIDDKGDVFYHTIEIELWIKGDSE